LYRLRFGGEDVEGDVFGGGGGVGGRDDFDDASDHDDSASDVSEEDEVVVGLYKLSAVDLYSLKPIPPRDFALMSFNIFISR
jgi:hypothetical protein